MISPVLSIMPLIQSTDGNRVAMSKSHHIQSQMLSQDGINISSEIPMIRTQFSDIFSRASQFFIKRALGPGVVRMVDNLIIIEYYDGEIDIIEKQPFYNIVVSNNQEIQKDQIIMIHKAYSPDLIIRYGVHMNAMFTRLRDTFEDAIVVSESGAKKLTSYMIEVVDIPISKKVFDINYEKLEQGILQEGDWIVKEYKKPIQLLSSPSYTHYAKHDMEIISMICQVFDPKIKVSGPVKDFLNKHSVDTEIEKVKKVVSPKNATRVKKSIMVNDEDAVAVLRITYKRLIPLEPGDKLVNRYGNKGVVSKIISDEEMRKEFPFADDVPYFQPEIIFNALGIHTRMNPSQLGELHLNFILKYIIPQYIKALQLRGKSNYEILEFVTKNIHMKLSETYGKKVLDTIKKLTEEQLDIIIKDILVNGLQIELPVFGDKYLLKIYEITKTLAPKYFNQIEHFGFGVFYIMKLEHMVEKKISAVSTSRYSSKFQPIDGQRVGEMETWDIIAYDAPHTLYSMQKIKSDEPHSKAIAYEKIVNYGKASIKDIEDSDPASKRLVESLLKTVNIDLKQV